MDSCESTLITQSSTYKYACLYNPLPLRSRPVRTTCVRLGFAANAAIGPFNLNPRDSNEASFGSEVSDVASFGVNPPPTPLLGDEAALGRSFEATVAALRPGRKFAIDAAAVCP